MMFYMLTENNGVNVTVGENQLLKNMEVTLKLIHHVYLQFLV